MTTDLEQRLREALHEDAARAHLFNPHGPPPEAPGRTVARHRRRPPVWLAVAAVMAVVVLAGAVALLDDDQSVDTGPSTVPAPGTIVAGDGCPFGITGDPVVMQPVPGGSRFEALGGQGVAYTTVGAQAVIVSVPGFDRGADGGWRDEAIDLERGPATVWLDGPPGASVIGDVSSFVQVRFFPETEDPCGSFTVSVEGGFEAEGRQTAIDFADRVVLPAELAAPDLAEAQAGSVAGLELTGTSWEIVDSSAGPISGAPMEFGDPRVTWDNGCTVVSADHELDREEGVLVLTNTDYGDGCGPPTTAGSTPHYPVIDAVMGSGRVPVRLVDGLLYLGDHPDGDFIVVVPHLGFVDEPLTMPEPGEPPADAAAAEEQVRHAYVTLGDTTIPEEERAPLSERPATWLAAAHEVKAGDMWDIVQSIHTEVDEVVFVSPTEAAVRFRLVSANESVPRDQIGKALLVDGRWVQAIETSCGLMSLTGVTCDLSL